MFILVLSTSRASLNENGRWPSFYQIFSAHHQSPEPAPRAVQLFISQQLDAQGIAKDLECTT